MAMGGCSLVSGWRSGKVEFLADRTVHSLQPDLVVSIDARAGSDKPGIVTRQTLPGVVGLPEPNRISPMRDPTPSPASADENVLDRLSRLTKIARSHGFEIRGAPLGGGANESGGGSTWCEIRGRRVLFLDLSQPAAEQAIAIREILEQTASVRPHGQPLSGASRQAA